MATEDVTRIVNHLRSVPGSVVELDEIGEAVGSASVTHDEIERIFVELEASGKTIGKPLPGAGSKLPMVMSAARQLKEKQGQAPSVQQIAALARLSEAEVRKALLLVQVMQR